MGRKNGHKHHGAARQRAQLVANKESRRHINDNLFSARRLLTPDSRADILEVVDILKVDGHLDEGFKVKESPLHVTLIEQQGIRRSLMRGIIGGYELYPALAQLNHGTRKTKETILDVPVKHLDLMDIGSNSLVALIEPDTILDNERNIIVERLGRLGLHHIDNGRRFRPHVTIGEFNGVPKVEKLRNKHVIQEMLPEMIFLQPLEFIPDIPDSK